MRRNCLLKQVIDGEAEETEIQGTPFIDVRHRSVLFTKSNCIDDEDVSSYYMTLRKRENTANCKRKHYSALCGELSFWKETALFLCNCAASGGNFLPTFRDILSVPPARFET